MTFPYRLVLFDLDGTLVDTASDIAEAVNRTLSELGLGIQDEAVVRGWIGEGARVLMQTALRHAGSDLDVDTVMPTLMVHYGETLLLDARLYPGVPETLQALHAQGVKIALCTNKPERFLRPLLDHLGIARYFEGMVGSDTLPQRKPDALPLLHLAQQAGCAVDDCLMVGDSETDFLAARAAHMPVVMVSYGYLRGFSLVDTGAVAVIDDMRELLALDTRHPGESRDPAAALKTGPRLSPG